MSCETSSVWIKTSSIWIKIVIFVLGLVCVVQIVGFATTSWATIDDSTSASALTVTATYSPGLWQRCYCAETAIFGKYCLFFLKRERSTDPGWFIAVQVLEAIGLAGLVICEIITFFSICSQPNKNLKIPILYILPGSGICIAIGVIIFGVEVKMDKVYDLFVDLRFLADAGVGLSGQVSYSLILCAIAAGLCFFVCLPLFILDMRSMPAASSQTTVHYSAQGHIIQPPPSYAPMSNQYPEPGNVQGQSNMAYQHPSYSYPQGYGQQLAPYTVEL